MDTVRVVLLASSMCAVLVGCGASAGGDPHAMSAADHDKAAKMESTEAKKDAAEYDPKAAVRSENCGHLPAGAPCWASVANPTSEHLGMAEEHRKAAAMHRASSLVLRNAEAKSCVGVSEQDRDESPFHHREDLVRVEPMGAPGKETGVIFVFKSVAGLTAAHLQKVVDCHVARNASLGHTVPEMPYCPLVPRDVSAKVSTVADGIAVTVESSNPATVKEILERSRALTPKK